MRFFLDADSWYQNLQKSVIFNPGNLDDIQREWLSGVAEKDFQRGVLSKTAYMAISANLGIVSQSSVAG